MASAFTHAIASVAIGKAGLQKEGWKFWLLGMFCAVIPDADAIGYFMGVPYDSLWGHRGFTHSFFFALLLALTVVISFYKDEKVFTRRWWILFLFFFFSTASHSMLDACTNGGLGVAFFAPFYNERYFFPWQVIKVSPMGVSRFFSHYGLEVLVSEFQWVWLPCILIIAIGTFLRKAIGK